MLAMNLITPRGARHPALSLTTIASKLAPTVAMDARSFAFCSVQRHGRLNQCLERGFINGVAFMQVDGSPGVAF